MIDENKLRELYIEKGMTIKDIVQILKCSNNQIKYLIIKYNLQKRFQDLTNKTFGLLTVIKKTNDKDQHGQTLWLCKCACGKYKIVNTTRLYKRKSSSCGCQNGCNRKNKRWKGYEDISGCFWNSIKTNAIRRKKEFNITIEYTWDLFIKQNKKCALTGVDITFSEYFKGNQTASLDRIDSSKGYIEGNVQWVHKRINSMKLNLKQEEFLDWCRKITEHNKIKENNEL